MKTLRWVLFLPVSLVTYLITSLLLQDMFRGLAFADFMIAARGAVACCIALLAGQWVAPAKRLGGWIMFGMYFWVLVFIYFAPLGQFVEGGYYKSMVEGVGIAAGCLIFYLASGAFRQRESK